MQDVSVSDLKAQEPFAYELVKLLRVPPKAKGKSGRAGGEANSLAGVGIEELMLALDEEGDNVMKVACRWVRENRAVVPGGRGTGGNIGFVPRGSRRK